MTLDGSSICRALKLNRPPDALQVGWTDSLRTMPAGPLGFLKDGFVGDACRAFGMPPEITDAARRAARHVEQDECRRALAWHGHALVFRAEGRPGRTCVWPSVQDLAKAFGEHAGVFYLLVLLSAWPALRALYRTRRLPAAVVRDTLADIGKLMLRRLTSHREAHGAWGMPPHFAWLGMVLSGEYVRLGRLCYERPRPWQPRFHVFRHRRRRTVLALSADGVRYLADGHLYGERRVGDGLTSWEARFAATRSGYVGVPLHPGGYALRQTVALPRADWRPIAGPDTPVPALIIHYPGGEPLDFDRCGRSLSAAVRFFPRHFPDWPFPVITGNTWFMNAQLQELLPPDSNMVRFQKEMYLFPLLSDDFMLLNQCLDPVPDALRSGPRHGSVALRLLECALAGHPLRARRETSLQRAIVDRLLAGKELRAKAGGCFLLPEDLRWGHQVYLRRTGPCLDRLLATSRAGRSARTPAKGTGR